MTILSLRRHYKSCSISLNNKTNIVTVRTVADSADPFVIYARQLPSIPRAVATNDHDIFATNDPRVRRRLNVRTRCTKYNKQKVKKERLKCPKMTILSLRRHYKSCGKSWEWTPEEKSPEATSENRQSERVRTWHVGAECSKYGQQQQGRPDRRHDRCGSLQNRFWILPLFIGLHAMAATNGASTWKPSQGTNLYCLVNRGTLVWTTCPWSLSHNAAAGSWTRDLPITSPTR